MKKIALILAGLLLPCTLAFSAGLGRLNVQSALGQPLRAEIEIVSLQSGEAESLSAALAAAEAFRQANIDLSSVLFAIRFAVERRPSGQFVVSLSSTQPINEPFIDMLVELSWSGGRLVREYTFLLDPPEYKSPSSATAVQPVAPPVVARPLPSEPAGPVAVPAPVPAAPASAAAPARPAAAKSAGTYEVKRGDTLAKIAQQTKPADVSLQQMLVALYRANEDAFIGNNMNRLRAGRILSVPDRDAVTGVSADEARRVVSAQSSDYAAFRRRIGAAVATAPARPDAGRQASGRIAPPAEEKAAPQQAAKDQLRLSKPDDAKKGGKAAAAASGDDLAAKDKALREARERIAMLEKSVEDMKKLAQLKSRAGAQLQEAAKGAPAAKAAEPAKAAKAPEPAKAAEAPKAPPAKAPEPAKAPAPETAKSPEPAKVAAPAPDAAKAAAPEASKAAAPKAVVKAAPPPPPPPPTLMDELLENDLTLPGAGGLLVLLIGYAAYKWRRKKQLAQSEGSVMGSEPVLASSVIGETGGRSVDTGGGVSSFQSDFSQGSVGKIDTEEIDPVAEADVYMAYGRDAQAEEILKDALAKDPGRQAIRMKLLDIYSNRKDRAAFESTARELQGAGGGGEGADWERAMALGVALDPENPLYGGTPGASSVMDTQVIAVQAETPGITEAPSLDAGAAQAAPAEEAPAAALDFDLDLGETPAEAGTSPDINLDASAAEAAGPDTSGGLDFDLDAGGGDAAPAKAESDTDFSPEGTLIVDASNAPAEPAAASADDGGLSIDFDLGMDAPKAEDAPAAPAPAPAAPAPAADDGNMMDFKLELPGDDAAPAPVEDVKPVDIDLSALSLDLGSMDADAPPEMDAKWQETATKLDLAKAYEDMGDKNGARELLNEVLAEGDAAQQALAKTMLEALG